MPLRRFISIIIIIILHNLSCLLLCYESYEYYYYYDAYSRDQGTSTPCLVPRLTFPLRSSSFNSAVTLDGFLPK